MQRSRFEIALICLIVAVTVGCRRNSRPDIPSEVTATAVRANRRAYNGAPPVIPHEPLKAACITCHTSKGEQVPNLGFAPANPHGDMGNINNCRQCHLFIADTNQFAESGFEGLPPAFTPGERLFAGAPPTIPHSLQMRANCLGLSQRPIVAPRNTLFTSRTRQLCPMPSGKSTCRFQKLVPPVATERKTKLPLDAVGKTCLPTREYLYTPRTAVPTAFEPAIVVTAVDRIAASVHIMLRQT